MTGCSISLGSRLPWMEKARCAGNLHFTDMPVTWQKAQCRQCPVIGECYMYGLEQPLSGDKHDTTVYGGLTEAQRRDEKRKRPTRLVLR